MLGLKLNHVSKRGHRRHQAITLTNVDLSPVRSCGIHLRAISHETFKISVLDMSSKIIHLRLQHQPQVKGVPGYEFQ